MIKLIGVLIVVIGFTFKFDTIAVVLVAGIATGIVADMSIVEILNTLGESFINTRYMTLFVLTLPVVGICERHGLKEKAIDFIRNKKNLTMGRVLTMYGGLRELAAAFSVRLGGHAQFVRPLVFPMAEGAAKVKYPEYDEEDEEKIKGLAAASDNFANFFGQNVFIGSSGVLLIVGTLTELGYEVDAATVATAAIPGAIVAFIAMAVYFEIMDRKLNKKYGIQRKGAEK